jgi:hypothetical protein
MAVGAWRVVKLLEERCCRPRRLGASSWLAVCPSCLRMGDEDGTLAVREIDGWAWLHCWTDEWFDTHCSEFAVWRALGLDLYAEIERDVTAVMRGEPAAKPQVKSPTHVFDRPERPRFAQRLWTPMPMPIRAA